MWAWVRIPPLTEIFFFFFSSLAFSLFLTLLVVLLYYIKCLNIEVAVSRCSTYALHARFLAFASKLAIVIALHFLIKRPLPTLVKVVGRYCCTVLVHVPYINKRRQSMSIKG